MPFFFFLKKCDLFKIITLNTGRIEIKIEAVVIGAGVVGLAVGKSLADKGIEVAVIEKENRIGEGASTRNSGVIHAGLYYSPKSLKAKLCCRGRKELYQYAATKNIPFKKTGKLIVATKKNQLKQLQSLYENGKANGVPLKILSKEKVKNIEEEIKCETAIFSSESGIISVPEYLSSLEEDIKKTGYVVLATELKHAEKINAHFELTLNSSDKIQCNFLINASGLHTEEVANRIEEINLPKIKTVMYAKGHYYLYKKKNPFKHLIYPLPNSNGHGIHAGMDIENNLRFGPNAKWVDSIEYSFNENTLDEFCNSIKSYWVNFDPSCLTPDYTGIRSKIVAEGEGSQDFEILDASDHGLNNFIHLQGIDSPGLTSSLAIAAEVMSKLGIH